MLCGCDYLDPIKGIGAKTALKLVKEYDTFEEILEHLKKGKSFPPDDWPYEEARDLFKHPNVTPASECEVCPPSLSPLPSLIRPARVEGPRRLRLGRLSRQGQGIQVRWS